MLKKFFLVWVLVFFPIYVGAQEAEDIVFHKPGFNIEKVLEINKLMEPFGTCFDENENLLITNWYGSIYQISPDGSLSKLKFGGYGYSSSLGYFYDIKINPLNHDIIVGGRTGIYKYDRNTGELLEISTSSCHHLVFDQYGNLFCSDNQGKYIQKHNLNSSSYTHAWTENLGFNPEGIIFDSIGDLYVCDYHGGRIVKLVPPYKGVPHETILEGMGRVYDLAIDEEDNLYVLAEDTGMPPDNWWVHRSMIIKINTGSYSYEIFKNDLPYSRNLTIENNEIFLSSTYYNSIKKIDIDGNLSNYTRDYEVIRLYTMASDLEGIPIIYDSRLGKIYRINSSNQLETLATDMGIIRCIEVNDIGELYCFSFWRNNIRENFLYKIPFDGSPPEIVADFDEKFSPGMRFLHRDNHQLVIHMRTLFELWLFDLTTKESIVLAKNLTNNLGFDLNDENYLYIQEGLNEAIKRAPYPTSPPIDMSSIPNFTTINVADPYQVRYFEVAPNNDIYIPAATPEGEIYVGPSVGGFAELLATGFSYPNATHFDRYGILWITDAGNGLFKITNKELIISQNIKNCSYLIEEIQESYIEGGFMKSLLIKLESTIRSLERDNANAAIGQLTAFKNLVRSQMGKKIPEDKAERWITIAAGIIKVLEEAL